MQGNQGVCPTCVEMTQDNQAMHEELIRLRASNKVLRTVNSTLHKRLKELHKEVDEIFLQLCEVDETIEFGHCIR